MTRRLSLAILISFAQLFTVLGQGFPQNIQDRIKELRESKIDTIVYYEDCCLLKFSMEIGYECPNYIVWFKNAHLFIQKFTTRLEKLREFSSAPVKANDTTLFWFLSTKTERLFNEPILPRIIHFKKDSFDYYWPVHTSHECIKYLMFILDDRQETLTLNQSDLFDKEPREGLQNLNYNFNQQLTVTRFQIRLDTIIRELEVNKRFVLK